MEFNSLLISINLSGFCFNSSFISSFNALPNFDISSNNFFGSTSFGFFNVFSTILLIFFCLSFFFLFFSCSSSSFFIFFSFSINCLSFSFILFSFLSFVDLKICFFSVFEFLFWIFFSDFIFSGTFKNFCLQFGHKKFDVLSFK